MREIPDEWVAGWRPCKTSCGRWGHASRVHINTDPLSGTHPASEVLRHIASLSVPSELFPGLQPCCLSVGSSPSCCTLQSRYSLRYWSSLSDLGLLRRCRLLADRDWVNLLVLTWGQVYESGVVGEQLKESAVLRHAWRNALPRSDSILAGRSHSRPILSPQRPSTPQPFSLKKT